jgi:hypothetical protein
MKIGMSKWMKMDENNAGVKMDENKEFDKYVKMDENRVPKKFFGLCANPV